MALGLSANCFSTPFRRCSKSPRYFVPASRAPMSRQYTVALARISGTRPSIMWRARPSAIAVLPTPASPTSNGLFLRRRQSVWITRSSSLSRPISGSIFPVSASWFKFWVKFSSAPPFSCVSVSVSAGSSLLLRPCGVLVMPCEMKFTTSRRETFWRWRKNTACESFSPKIATRTLAPVTSFFPDDCTWRIARWMTLWNPSVGWVSISSLPATVGVCSLIKVSSSLRRPSMSAAHARRTSAADGLSSSASSKCSTVMNSCRFLPCLDKGHVQADFKFLGNHQSSSITQASGCWCLRESIR
jgi:hypothetical protein